MTMGTYYYIVVILVARKIHKCEMKNHIKQKLPSEESHPVTDPLGENRRNPAKKQEKSLPLHDLNTIITNIILYYFIRNRKKIQFN